MSSQERCCGVHSTVPENRNFILRYGGSNVAAPQRRGRKSTTGTFLWLPPLGDGGGRKCSGNGAVKFTAPFPRTEILFSVTVAAIMLHRDGEGKSRPQERSCGGHRLVPEEKDDVLRNGVVICTAPFLRTGNPFSITVPAITLHHDGEPTKQKTGTGKGENRKSAGEWATTEQNKNCEVGVFGK